MMNKQVFADQHQGASRRLSQHTSLSLAPSVTHQRSSSLACSLAVAGLRYYSASPPLAPATSATTTSPSRARASPPLVHCPVLLGVCGTSVLYLQASPAVHWQLRASNLKTREPDDRQTFEMIRKSLELYGWTHIESKALGM